MVYQGTFTIGLKENFRYNFFITKRRMLATSGIVFVIILVLLAFFKSIYGQVASIVDGFLYSLPMAAIGAVVLFLFSLGFMYIRLRSMYKKKAIDPFDQKVRLDNAGVHATTAKGNIDLPWNKVGLIRESGSDFVIFVTDSIAYVLPKDQMKNPSEDVANIRAIFHKYMDNSKLHLKG